MLREKPLKMARLVPIKKAGRDFDVEFWQKLEASAIFIGHLGLSGNSRENEKP